MVGLLPLVSGALVVTPFSFLEELTGRWFLKDSTEGSLVFTVVLDVEKGFGEPL